MSMGPKRNGVEGESAGSQTVPLDRVLTLQSSIYP